MFVFFMTKITDYKVKTFFICLEAMCYLYIFNFSFCYQELAGRRNIFLHYIVNYFYQRLGFNKKFKYKGLILLLFSVYKIIVIFIKPFLPKYYFQNLMVFSVLFVFLYLKILNICFYSIN